MTFGRWLLPARLHLAMLRCAAWLAPSPWRAEWLAEWKAELWYVDRGATRFCLGAFCDAFWLRRNSATADARRAFTLDSPLRCLLFLAALAGASLFFAFCLPLARNMLLPLPYRDARNLAMISADRQYDATVPTVPFEQFQSLVNRTQQRFTGLAFYRPVPMRVATAPRASAELSIAVASANLFQLLDLPSSTAALMPGQRQSAAPLVLSHAAWRKYFDSDPHIVGRVLEVGRQPAVVCAVIDAGSWRLPGRMDAWLLEDLPRLAHLPPHIEGFVLGRFAIYASQPRPHPSWAFSVPNERGGYDRFACCSLAEEHVLLGCLMLCCLSLLILSTVTSLGLGEYPASRYSSTGATTLRRWIFLAVKIALVLPIAWFGSLDLAAIASVHALPHVTLVGLIAGFRWALIDQRQRCPVCLRSLTNPTRIGSPSRVFLEWSGTEFICSHGHGLLYVSEIRTSCYGTQRWQYLDPSWSSLFS